MNKTLKIGLSLLTIIIVIAGVVVFFKTNTYTVNFYNDGNLVETIETRKNKTIKAPEQPKKDGYVFIGWYTKDGEVFDFEKNITENTILYARWATIVKDN